MMNRRAWAGLALSFCLSMAAMSAAKPDFSGEWKMNMTKSDLGQMPMPDKYEMKVEHKEPEVKTTTVQAGQMGERTTEAVYKTDGTETTNRMGPNESKSTAKWDGDALLISTKATFQGNPVQMESKWTLSSDGKTLTIEQTFKSDMGEFTMKRVMDKQ